MLSLTVGYFTQKYINDLSQKPNDQSPKTGKESIFASFKGSMTPEASLVVPIFIFFLMSILMSVEMVRLQSDVNGALHQGISVSAVLLSGKEGTTVSEEYMELPHCSNPVLRGKVRFEAEEGIETDGIISIRAGFKMKPFFSLFEIGDFDSKESLTAHEFSGYTGNEEGNGISNTLEYVFVTPKGSKYHRDSDCMYLRVNPKSVEYSKIKNLRNNDGHKYYPCERCRPSKTGLVWITPEGTSYHSAANCPSLKRTVKVISIEEALSSGYSPCSNCG